MVGSSEYLCSAGGKFCNHSTEFVCVCVCGGGGRICQFDVILALMMKRNVITLTNVIVDLIEEIMCHVAYG